MYIHYGVSIFFRCKISQCKKIVKDNNGASNLVAHMKTWYMLATADEYGLKVIESKWARRAYWLIGDWFKYYYTFGVSFYPLYLTACACCPDNLIYLTDVEKRTAKSIIIKTGRMISNLHKKYAHLIPHPLSSLTVWHSLMPYSPTRVSMGRKWSTGNTDIILVFTGIF